MLAEPLQRTEALRLARQILVTGSIVFTEHSLDRGDQRRLTAEDVENVIKYGFIRDEPEQDERGRWSYRIETPAMAVIVAFRSEEQMKIVTVFRKATP